MSMTVSPTGENSLGRRGSSWVIPMTVSHEILWHEPQADICILWRPQCPDANELSSFSDWYSCKQVCSHVPVSVCVSLHIFCCFYLLLIRENPIAERLACMGENFWNDACPNSFLSQSSPICQITAAHCILITAHCEWGHTWLSAARGAPDFRAHAIFKYLRGFCWAHNLTIWDAPKLKLFFQCHARGFKSFRSWSILSFIFLDEGCSPVFTLWGTILKCYPKNWPSTGERSFTNTRLLPASVSPYHCLQSWTTSELYVNKLPCS